MDWTITSKWNGYMEKKKGWLSRMDFGEWRDLIPVRLVGLEKIARRCGSKRSRMVSGERILISVVILNLNVTISTHVLQKSYILLNLSYYGDHYPSQGRRVDMKRCMKTLRSFYQAQKI